MSRPNKPTDEELRNFALASVGEPVPAPVEVLPAPIVAEALALYMNFVPVTMIRKETGLSQAKLNALIYGEKLDGVGGWKEEREKFHTDVVQGIRHKSVKRLRRANQISLRLITRGLMAYEKR